MLASKGLPAKGRPQALGQQLSKGSTAMGRVHAQKLFAYWLTSVGSLAMQYSFSIIFVDLLVAFDSTRAATAAVGSLSAGLMDGFGVVSGRAIARRGEVVCGSVGASEQIK